MSKQLNLRSLPTFDFIEKLVADLWPAEHYDHQKVEININPKEGEIRISISRMYEYVELSFSLLKEISERLGCAEISESRSCSSGCETCDYGSTYTIELRCWDFGKGKK